MLRCLAKDASHAAVNQSFQLTNNCRYGPWCASAISLLSAAHSTFVCVLVLKLTCLALLYSIYCFSCSGNAACELLRCIGVTQAVSLRGCVCVCARARAVPANVQAWVRARVRVCECVRERPHYSSGTRLLDRAI